MKRQEKAEAAESGYGTSPVDGNDNEETESASAVSETPASNNADAPTEEATPRDYRLSPTETFLWRLIHHQAQQIPLHHQPADRAFTGEHVESPQFRQQFDFHPDEQELRDNELDSFEENFIRDIWEADDEDLEEYDSPPSPDNE